MSNDMRKLIEAVSLQENKISTWDDVANYAGMMAQEYMKDSVNDGSAGPESLRDPAAMKEAVVGMLEYMTEEDLYPGARDLIFARAAEDIVRRMLRNPR